jgi:hypothetical protein
MSRLRELIADPWVRYVELRAERIDDPVRRLKYLRQMMAVPAWLDSRVFTRRMAWRAGIAGAILLVPFGWRWTPVTQGRDAQPRVLSASVAPHETHLDETPPANQSVWLVERHKEYEMYSNGLRIERRFETAGDPRSYFQFERAGDPAKAPLRTEPAGIVFHTTESNLAPFDRAHNETLRRFGTALVEYTSREKLYHYVVDRFGQVNRAVRESDVAYHAGHSVWADEAGIYVRLNHSFLGVSFEGRSTGSGEERTINHAQIHAGRLLTAMLRDKYQIAEENCVTHAQVSVSPLTRKVGYHTDWAANFPFREVGLKNNYKLPLWSVAVFGFAPSDEYMELADPDLREAVRSAEKGLEDEARQQNVTLSQHRAERLREFARFGNAMRQIRAVKETD